ncbi:MAG: DEAD/DEAH box helicase [Myxococcota bacterium]
MTHPPSDRKGEPSGDASPEARAAASTRFEDFDLDPRIVEALGSLGFDEPTPIQAEALPPLLSGRDVIGRARTGSGKTAAFGLPLLERVADGGDGDVKALVLAPTRELALQVTDALRTFAKKLPVRLVTVYGGASYGPQLAALRQGVPVVVGTPGRVLDHLERGTLDLSALEMLVLDEADEMLRMGFLEDVETILARTPPDRQVALFSATMPERIRAIASGHLNDPLTVQVEGKALSTGHIAQRAVVVPQRFKAETLQRLLAAEPIEAAIVFARTRAGAAEIADLLARSGLAADALHGDLNQTARERVLTRFREGVLEVVVATDVAARGIDVDRISHVFNLDLPPDPETYVHRIGRTGRAGREGVAISLVTPAEVPRARYFQRALKVQIERMPVPSDAVIMSARSDELQQLLDAQLAEGVGPGAAELVEALQEEHDLGAIAAAALSLLAAGHGLDLEGKFDEDPPRWAQQRVPAERKGGKGAGRERGERGPREPRGPRPARGEADAVELFLPVGRKRGVRPADLVGALANDAGIDGRSIGRITILDSKSFVRVSEASAARILERGDVEVRGKRVPVKPAHRPAGPDAGPRPKKGRRRPPGAPRRDP